METAPRLGHIYGLSCSCHPELGVRYVGLTRFTISRRLVQHRSNSRHGIFPSSAWIRKHGTENIIATELAIGTLFELPALEVWWIADLRTRGQADLNMTDGGEGVRNLSVETRAKIAAASLGRVNSPASILLWKESRARGGKNRGEDHHRAKLTRVQVRTIRARPLDSSKDLASEFCVSKDTINKIRNGKLWKELAA